METPRLSVCSEVSDYSSGETPSSYEGAVTPPIGSPAVTLGPIVVNAGGTGILHGNVNSYTLNQYIVPVTNGDTTDWTANAVDHLVTDAVKQLSTDTKKKFFPNDDTNVLPGDKEKLRSLQRRWCCLIAALIALSLFSLLSTLVLSMSSIHDNGALPISDYDANKQGMEGADLLGAPPLMSRATWVAQPPKRTLDDNHLPADTVVVCHTATETCNTTASCVLGVRLIQQFHIESRGWDDIAYNYVVGGDDRVYVGRGWDKMGAHTKAYNNGTVGVAFFGTFDNQLPTANQLKAFKQLLDIGVRVGKLTKDYSLVAQCQLRTTAAPGAAIVKEISSWPHYDKSLPTSGCTTL